MSPHNIMKRYSLASFLYKRELGLTKRNWREKEKTDTYLEEHASKPSVNQPCSMSGQCRATFLTDFSPDGTKVASTHGDHTVRVTEISTGKCTHILRGHPRTPWCIAFHPSADQILATGCLGGEVRIWDLQGGGSEVWRSKDNQVIASLTFHPTDQVLVFAVATEIYFWDWSQPEPFAHSQTRYEYEKIRWVKFDTLGHFLYTGIANDTTVQPTTSSRVSFISGRNSHQSQGQSRTQQLSSVYDSLVECFQASQRNRIMNQMPSGSDAGNSDGHDTSERSSGISHPDRQRSPVHEEGLDHARQYASHITATSGGVSSGASLSDLNSNLSVHVPSENSQTSENEGISAVGDFQRPFTWSPPPRGASAENDSEFVINVEDVCPPVSEENTVDPLGGVSVSSSLLSSSDSSGNSHNATGGATAVHSNMTHSTGGFIRPIHAPFQAIPNSSNVRVISESQAFNENSNRSITSYGNSNIQRQSGLFSFGQSRTRNSASRRLGCNSGSQRVTGLFGSRQSSFRSSEPRDEHSEIMENASIIRSERDPERRVLHSNSCSASTTDCLNFECGDNCQVCCNYDTTRLNQGAHAQSFTRMRNVRQLLQERMSDQERSAFTRPFSRFHCRSQRNRRNHVHSLQDLSSSQLGRWSEIRQLGNQSSTATENSEQENGPDHTSVQSSDARLTNVSDEIRSYESIHENFATITARIEREMNELDRRISALRNTFNESIRRLQHDRARFCSARGDNQTEMIENESQVSPPVITITRYRDEQTNDQPILSHDVSSARPNEGALNRDSNYHLLESALRNSHSSSLQFGDSLSRASDSSHMWQSLERHHLHPHYSVSILDNAINRPNDPIQSAINRAIADAFMGRGEPAVAANIINKTHRIQAWDFSNCDIPDLKDAKSNIIVQHCKLHNEASCDISRDGSMLATFVPSHRGFPDDNILAVYSLQSKTRGQCLYTKSFGPNAISVSLSPRNQFVMVGLAAKRLSWVFTPNQLVAKILKLQNQQAGENSMQLVTDVMHPCDMDIRTHVSVNSARWLPGPGEGIVYGTNKGDLHICRPGSKMTVKGDNSEETVSSGSIRRNLMHMLRMSGGQELPLINTATQTQGVRRSAGTQTDLSDVHRQR